MINKLKDLWWDSNPSRPEPKQPDAYEIDWDKVRTTRHLKALLRIFTKNIDHKRSLTQRALDRFPELKSVVKDYPTND